MVLLSPAKSILLKDQPAALLIIFLTEMDDYLYEKLLHDDTAFKSSNHQAGLGSGKLRFIEIRKGHVSRHFCNNYCKGI
jgi:hypothetical protein